MTDDLISRKAALNIVARALSPITSLYQLIEADISALPAANTSAMGAADIYCNGPWDYFNAAEDATAPPDHAAQLAEALALPEVAAMQADLADLQADLARYMSIAGDESERADAAEADKAALVEALERILPLLPQASLPVADKILAALERTAKP